MKRDQDEFRPEGASGQSDAPSAVLGEQSDSSIQEQQVAEAEKMLDITRIPQGFTHRNKAFFLASMFHAAGGTRAKMEARELSSEDKEKERRIRQQRELERFMAWNAEMVTVGGVRMTNGEAQAARRRFIENEDLHARRAVQRGYIKAGEEEELKRTMRRRLELEDRKGRGTLTDAERAELDRLSRSRCGQAGDRMTADIHQESGLDRNTGSQLESDADRAKLSESDLFQSAPDLNAAFTQAHDAAAPSQSPSAPTHVPVLHEVKNSGLNL